MTSSKAWVGAIVAAVLAGLSALAVVVTGDATLANVTVGQWIAVAIAVITSGSSTFGLVYHTSNAPGSSAISRTAGQLRLGYSGISASSATVSGPINLTPPAGE